MRGVCFGFWDGAGGLKTGEDRTWCGFSKQGVSQDKWLWPIKLRNNCGRHPSREWLVSPRFLARSEIQLVTKPQSRYARLAAFWPPGWTVERAGTDASTLDTRFTSAKSGATFNLPVYVGRKNRSKAEKVAQAENVDVSTVVNELVRRASAVKKSSSG